MTPCSSKKGSLAAFLEDLAIGQLLVCVLFWEVQNRSCPLNPGENSGGSEFETLCDRGLAFPLPSQNIYLFCHLTATGSVKIMFLWNLPSSNRETEELAPCFSLPFIATEYRAWNGSYLPQPTNDERSKVSSFSCHPVWGMHSRYVLPLLMRKTQFS